VDHSMGLLVGMGLAWAYRLLWVARCLVLWCGRQACRQGGMYVNTEIELQPPFRDSDGGLLGDKRGKRQTIWKSG